MKPFPYNSLKKILLVLCMFALANFSKAQDEKKDMPDKEAIIKTMIDAHRYVFKAQSVHPNRGNMVQLNAEYDLSVSKDTVRSYLPYFGRAYSAPLDGRSGGIDFLSKNFEYNQKSRKKGGWDIVIKPKDANDVRELLLTVFDNGYASLLVSSNNREPISFNGYLAEK